MARRFEPQGTRSDDITPLHHRPLGGSASHHPAIQHPLHLTSAPSNASMPVNEEKFTLFLKPVFQQGNVVIYEVPK
jgi:hypothetical protein